MKILSMQAAIALTLCSLAFAHNNFAQLLDKKVNITLRDVPIDEALEAIGDLTNVKFFYSIDQLAIKEKINLVAVDRPLRNVLDELLGKRDVSYKVHEKRSTITLKKHERKSQSFLTPAEDATRAALMASVLQPGIVSGTVIDGATLQPMVGVNIIVKGTTNGTSSDAEGKFSIRAEGKDVLVFSFIGYKTVESQANNLTALDIQMVQDISTLREVTVNAGYYKTTKEYQTGNIARISSEEIQRQPVSNPIAALQGRMSGVQITQSTGVPGGNFTVRIRGNNSIANGNDPLYIIDGVPFTSATLANAASSGGIYSNGTSPLNGINPADIQSIEVLKDADATAIYGSRGSNGVVLITTRKARQGDTRLDLNYYTGFGKIATKVDLLNTPQYLEMRDEAFANAGLTPQPSDYDVNGVWSRDRDTDWQDALIGGTAHSTDLQASISGGEKNTQFAISTGYHKETTVFPGDYADRRISTRVNLTNSSANNKLNTSVTLNYNIGNTNLVKTDLTSTALSLAPNAPALYNDQGDINWENSTWYNPLAYLKTTYEAQNTTLVGNAVVGYAIIDGLEISASFGYTNMRMDALSKAPKSATDPVYAMYAQHSSVFSNGTFTNYIIEPQLNWNRVFRKGTLKVLLGASVLDQKSSSFGQYASGFASEALMEDIRAASTMRVANNSSTNYKYASAFARLNYIFNEKYIANLTARRDGSSRFGPDQQFANFAAAGLGWIFSKERLIRNSISFLSFGKLRASYGSTGNDQLPDYAYLDSYSSTTPYNGIPGLNPQRLSNPDFSWELNRKFEVSIELGFFDDKFLLNVARYSNKSSSQLVGFPLSPTTGFTTIQGNFPATVENRGYEFDLMLNALNKTDFTWSLTLNASLPNNELLEFQDLQSSPSYANTYVVGKPLNISKTYRYTGINPSTGLYEFEDVNGDGIFNQLDRYVVNEIGPRFFGGLANNFRFQVFNSMYFFNMSTRKTTTT
jgi:TonB-dependent starch-binding outer membrane protein SusC